MSDILIAINAAEKQAAEAHSDTEALHRECDDNQFKQDWPDEVLNPPGLVGEVVQWIRDSAGMYQPKFALAAGLTVCGALIGRGVKDYTGQRTNINMLVIGGTSTGKDAPIRASSKLIEALGMQKILVGEITSDSALEMLLDDFPVRLFLLDEVGQYFTTMKSAGQSNGHLRSVIPALTKCWSCASGTFMGKGRSKDASGKWSPPRQIAEPCVCLYGTSAPDVLFGAMTEADFADGSIPRFIVFISESRPMYETKPQIEVPDDLKSRLAEALRSLGIPAHCEKGHGGNATDVPSAMLVSETDEATARFADLEAVKHESMVRADNGDKVLLLYGKIVENARRIALTVAVFRNPSNPCIERQDADYACTLALLAVRDMVATVRDRVASNRTERIRKQVRLVIRRAGDIGITKSDLTRKMQSLKPIERDEAIQDLIDAEVIEERTEAGSGKKEIHRFFYRG